MSGDGNSYTTEFRQLDPRLGRWFSVDPIEQEYPFISPYASMFNNPINRNDIYGLGDPTYKKDAKNDDVQGDKDDKGNETSSYWLYSTGKWVYVLKEDHMKYQEYKKGLTADEQKEYSFEEWAITEGNYMEGYFKDKSLVKWNNDLKPKPVAPAEQLNTQKTASKDKLKTVADNLPANNDKKATPWLDYAKTQIGTKENKKSGEHNPKIIEYLKTAGNAGTSDETPWCAAFAHWSLNKAGIKGSGALGSNWREWGTKLDKPAVGAIVVFTRGHVGMIMGKTKDGKIVIIHGNWSDKVSVTSEGWGYEFEDDIQDIRYPAGYTPNYNLPIIDKPNQ